MADIIDLTERRARDHNEQLHDALISMLITQGNLIEYVSGRPALKSFLLMVMLAAFDTAEKRLGSVAANSILTSFIGEITP